MRGKDKTAKKFYRQAHVTLQSSVLVAQETTL
jgi:hypothetical protein